MRRITLLCFSVLVALWAGTASVSAHASLTSCSIKNGQVFSAKSAPRLIQAYFAENLDPKHSWINVFEGVGDHGLVNEHTQSRINFQNPKELTLKVPALRHEKYYLVWYTHSADDGHYAAGIVYFQVR